MTEVRVKGLMSIITEQRHLPRDA